MKYINHGLTLSKAKEATFIKMSQMLGWDKLHYDTYPNKDFNIWHFPPENRAKPGTRKIIPNFSVNAVQDNEI